MIWWILAILFFVGLMLFVVSALILNSHLAQWDEGLDR